MIIDGKKLANQILADLSVEVAKLKERNIIPTLRVILIGDNPASLSYIKQKQKAAEVIGAKLNLSHQTLASLKLRRSGSVVSRQSLKSLIDESNNNSSIHGIIIQRPLPAETKDLQPLLLTVNPQKDVDGFVPGSPYPVPVALAVEKILMNIYSSSEESPTNREATSERSRQSLSRAESRDSNNNYLSWLRTQNIVIVGRGETAGKPIHDHFTKLGCATSVITSQTSNPDPILKNATIIISCVGKERVIRATSISKGVVLISVGIWRDREAKLHGDYEEEEVKDIASFYSPTPGGVGPVNVACLMHNLVAAVTKL